MNPTQAMRHPVIAITAAIALMLFTFLVVYVPAGVLVEALHMTTTAAVPMTIAITFAIACLMMAWHVRRGTDTPATFGFRWPRWRHVGWTFVIAVPFAVLAGWATLHATEPGTGGPLAGVHFPVWQQYLYFALFAAIQEETIFRGLLQSTLARRLAAIPESAGASGVVAMGCVALLFGGIHLVAGWVTALFATVLSVIAGELRRRSGSLLPAMICHSLFNVAAILWVVR